MIRGNVQVATLRGWCWIRLEFKLKTFQSQSSHTMSFSSFSELSCLGTLVTAGELYLVIPYLPCDRCSLLPSRTAAYHIGLRILGDDTRSDQAVDFAAGFREWHGCPLEEYPVL